MHDGDYSRLPIANVKQNTIRKSMAYTTPDTASNISPSLRISLDLSQTG